MVRHRFWASFLEIEETPLTGLVSLKTDSSAVNVHLHWCPSFLSFELFSGSSIYLFFRPSTLSPPHSLSSPSPLPLFITLALQVAIFSLQDRYKWHHSAEKKQERTAWWDSSPPFLFSFFFSRIACSVERPENEHSESPHSSRGNAHDAEAFQEC